MSETQILPVLEHTSKHVSSKTLKETEQKKKPRNLKNARKRSKSFTGGGICKIKNMRPVLPTRFLLGGNIRDPLNLNSLQDEEVNRAMNAVTPQSSPVPTPPSRKGQVPVIIPRNIKDPLNLDCEDDAEYELQFCSLTKRCRKKRLRKKRTSSGTSEAADADNSGCIEAKTPESQDDSAKIPEIVEPKPELTLDLEQNKNKRKSEEHLKDHVKKLRHFSMDKIVSPVVPQPGSWIMKRGSNRKDVNRGGDKRQNDNQTMPSFKEKNAQFQYGNYNRYYGYRNQHSDVDLRLLCFSQHQQLFHGKDILDIGCNIGHITLSIARDFGAKSILGIDIDNKLVSIARKNIKHYVQSTDSPPHGNSENNKGETENKISEFFPISMPILYGPIEIPGHGKESNSRRFPSNVTFKQANYILEDDTLLSLEQPQFDVILCLSITKWIHLNWGDAGIKQAFRRMYSQLRPGGKLILEPQNWASYKNKKKLTETIYKHFNTIEFFPEKFTEYLLSNEVGFAKSEILSFSQHHSRGFQRPIQVYTKSNLSHNECSESTNSSVVQLVSSCKTVCEVDNTISETNVNDSSGSNH